MPKTEVISIRVDRELSERLDALSTATGRPRAYYLREALAEHLDDLEDYYLAVETAQRIHAGTTRTYTSDQARAALDIDDEPDDGDALSLIA